MTWTATFSQDTDINDEGTVTATWIDVAAGESYTYTARVNSKGGLAAFVTAAKSGLSDYRVTRSKVANIEAKIVTALTA